MARIALCKVRASAHPNYVEELEAKFRQDIANIPIFARGTVTEMKRKWFLEEFSKRKDTVDGPSLWDEVSCWLDSSEVDLPATSGRKCFAHDFGA